MATFSLVLLASIFVLYLVWRVFMRLWFDPLASAKPAHWSTPYTGIWIWWQHVQDRSAEAVHQAHLRHGPVVRLGPSELSACCVDGGLDVIYSFKEALPKTDWYQVANSYGQEPMVALKEEAPHRVRKKMLALPYSKTALRTNQPWLRKQAHTIVRLKSALDRTISEEVNLDFYDLAFAWSVDFTSEYLFRPHANFKLLDDMSRARRVREDYQQQRTYQFLPLPTVLLDRMGYTAEIGWLYETMRSARSVARQESASVLGYFTDALAKESEMQKDPLESDQDDVVFSELQDHMIAGVDTSAMVLTACAWQLSLPANRIWQTRLAEELRSADQPTAAAGLEELPLLSAITREVLRLHAPVAGSQPRRTTRSVELGPEGHRILVPKGITVHSQAHTLHRSSAFQDPERFDPARWLDASPMDLSEMKRWYWPFGSGSRACIGEQLGTDGLKIALASLYGSYCTGLVEGTTFALSKGVVAMPIDQGGYHLRLHVRSRTKAD